MPLAQLYRRHILARCSLLLGSLLEVLIVQLHERDVVRPYIKEHKFFPEDVLCKLIWHVEYLV